jgi:hypothetical protein
VIRLQGDYEHPERGAYDPGDPNDPRSRAYRDHLEREVLATEAHNAQLRAQTPEGQRGTPNPYGTYPYVLRGKRPVGPTKKFLREGLGDELLDIHRRYPEYFTAAGRPRTIPPQFDTFEDWVISGQMPPTQDTALTRYPKGTPGGPMTAADKKRQKEWYRTKDVTPVDLRRVDTITRRAEQDLYNQAERRERIEHPERFGLGGQGTRLPVRKGGYGEDSPIRPRPNIPDRAEIIARHPEMAPPKPRPGPSLLQRIQNLFRAVPPSAQPPWYHRPAAPRPPPGWVQVKAAKPVPPQTPLGGAWRRANVVPRDWRDFLPQLGHQLTHPWEIPGDLARNIGDIGAAGQEYDWRTKGYLPPEEAAWVRQHRLRPLPPPAQAVRPPAQAVRPLARGARGGRGSRIKTNQGAPRPRVKPPTVPNIPAPEYVDDFDEWINTPAGQRWQAAHDAALAAEASKAYAGDVADNSLRFRGSFRERAKNRPSHIPYRYWNGGVPQTPTNFMDSLTGYARRLYPLLQPPGRETPPIREIENWRARIRGYPQSAKLEGDNDLHVEMGDAPGWYGEHMITEVPAGPEYHGARVAVRDLIERRQGTPWGGQGVYLYPAPQMDMEGYPFIDAGGHALGGDPLAVGASTGRGMTKGPGGRMVKRLIEIHPFYQFGPAGTLPQPGSHKAEGGFSMGVEQAMDAVYLAVKAVGVGERTGSRRTVRRVWELLRNLQGVAYKETPTVTYGGEGDPYRNQRGKIRTGVGQATEGDPWNQVVAADWDYRAARHIPQEVRDPDPGNISHMGGTDQDPWPDIRAESAYQQALVDAAEAATHGPGGGKMPGGRGVSLAGVPPTVTTSLDQGLRFTGMGTYTPLVSTGQFTTPPTVETIPAGSGGGFAGYDPDNPVQFGRPPGTAGGAGGFTGNLGGFHAKPTAAGGSRELTLEGWLALYYPGWASLTQEQRRQIKEQYGVKAAHGWQPYANGLAPAAQAPVRRTGSADLGLDPFGVTAWGGALGVGIGPTGSRAPTGGQGGLGSGHYGGGSTGGGSKTPLDQIRFPPINVDQRGTGTTIGGLTGTTAGGEPPWAPRWDNEPDVPTQKETQQRLDEFFANWGGGGTDLGGMYYAPFITRINAEGQAEWANPPPQPGPDSHPAASLSAAERAAVEKMLKKGFRVEDIERWLLDVRNQSSHVTIPSTGAKSLRRMEDALKAMARGARGQAPDPLEDALARMRDAVARSGQAGRDPREEWGKEAGEEWSRYVIHGGELKAVPGEEGRFYGQLIRWGSPEECDMSVMKDFFTPETDLALDWYKSEDGEPAWLPLFYHHAMEPKTADSPRVGYFKAISSADGVWIQGEMDKSTRYWERVWSLIKEGKAHLSTDSAPHLITRTPAAKGTNRVDRFPILGASATVSPAEWRLPPMVPIQ